MATKSKDSVAADSALKRIGDSWDKEAWTTEVYFNQNKTGAAQIAPAEARSRGILQEAAGNLQNAGSAQYQKNTEQAMLPLMRQCAQSSNDDQGKFELVVQVGKDGGTEDTWPPSRRDGHVHAPRVVRITYQERNIFSTAASSSLLARPSMDPAAANTSAAN